MIQRRPEKYFRSPNINLFPVIGRPVDGWGNGILCPTISFIHFCLPLNTLTEQTGKNLLNEKCCIGKKEGKKVERTKRSHPPTKSFSLLTSHSVNAQHPQRSTPLLCFRYIINMRE